MATIIRLAHISVALLSVTLCSLPRLTLAQDNVTVPKSRLEELERKEKELERLKGEQPKPQVDAVEPRKQTEPPSPQPVLAPAPEPAIRYSSPALESLPPLRSYDVVDSMDLANYYYADTASADR